MHKAKYTSNRYLARVPVEDAKEDGDEDEHHDPQEVHCGVAHREDDVLRKEYLHLHSGSQRDAAERESAKMK